MPRRAPSRPARRRPTPPPPPRVPVRRWWLLATTALLPVTGTALAQSPTGGQVVAGQAAIAQSGNRTTITQRTDRAAIDWQQFNVGAQSSVQFVQPNQGSWTLNRVVGPDPSVIAGRIQANGGVAIVNQSGMVFAGGAQVDVGSLIASAANITNNNFMAGRMVFDGAPRPGARVENRGTITVADRGLAALVGPGVSNSGVIRANLGRVALGAAETFVLDLAGDGLIGIDVTRAVTAAPDGGAALVTNSGVIEAQGGSVLISAHAASGLVEDLVRNTGRIEANTAGGRTGEIALRAEGGSLRQEGAITATGGTGQRGGTVALQATGQVTVGAAARVDASGGAGGGRVLVGTTGRGRNQTMAARTVVERGAEIRADATQNGHGGEIVVNSADRTEMRGTLSARGGETGGNGGFIEVSGQSAFVLDGIVDLTAAQGDLGTFLLDPRNILIADADVDPPSGTVTETPGDLTTIGGSVTGTGAVSATTGADGEWVRITPDVIEGYAAGNIILEASREIVIASAVNRATAGNLTLSAGMEGVAGTGNITQNAGANLTINGVLTLETGAGGISLAGDLRATGVVLSATGSIAQSTGSIAHRTAGTELPLTVTATGPGASVSLAGVANGTIGLQASSAAGDFALTGTAIRVLGALNADTVALTATAGPLTLDADLRAASLALTAEGNIAQTGGTIAHGTAGAELALTATATGDESSVTLTGAGNGPVALGGGGAGADFALSAESIRVTGPLTADTVALTAVTGTIGIGADIRATDLTLAAVTGIAQTGGTIAHRADPATALPVTATLSGAGDIVLARDNGSLRLRTGGTADGDMTATSAERLEIGDGQTLTVNGAAALSVTGDGTPIVLAGSLRAESASFTTEGGDVTQTGGTIAHVTSGSEMTLAVNGTGEASVDLTAAGNGIFAVANSAVPGGFDLAGSAIRLAGYVIAGDTSLTATHGILSLGGDIRVTSLALTAATGILQTAGNIEHRDNATTALPLALMVTGTGDIALGQTNGTLRLLSGGTADGSLGISSFRGIELAAGETLSVAGAASLAVTLDDNTLTLNGSLFADSITLSAEGQITQGAEGVLARRAADGGAALTSDLPLTVTVTGNGHGVALASAENGRLTVLGATTEDGSIALRGRNLVVAGAVTAEDNGAGRRDVTLTSTFGVALDAAITARNATIAAGGAVTQTAALDLGGPGGGRLRVRGAGGGANSAAGSIDLTGSNAVTELDARASGALAFTAAGNLTVTQARGAGVSLTGAALSVPDGTEGQSGIVATGSGDVAVIADSLTAPGTIAAPDGRTISLRVDALDLAGGSVSAGATGTVEIGPRSSGRAVQIGTSGNPADTTELATADLEAITAGTLRIGRTTIASEATQTITAAGLTVADAVAPTAALSLISANGINVNAGIAAPSVRMETTAGNIALGAVTVQAEGPGAAITLLSAGGITQAAGGALVSPDGMVVDLVAHAQSSISLLGTGDFRLTGGITPALASGERSLYAASGISFTTTGAITVAAPMELTASSSLATLAGRSISIEAPILLPAVSSLSLTASGGVAESTITQTAAGIISTGLLTLSAEGAIDLSLAANEVGTLGAVSFTDGFGYRSTTGFTVGGALAPSDSGNADITIIADTGNILLQAPISAGSGTVRLDATTGDIVQDSAGAAITAGRLELTAGRDALLDPTLAADRNAVGTLGGGTIGRTLRFNAAGDLTLDGSLVQTGPGGEVRIEAGGTLTQNAGGVLGFDGITLLASGAVTLGGTIGLDQPVPVSAVRLGTDAGIVQQAGGRIVADSLGISATGDVLLADGTNDVRQIAAMTDGAFALDTNGVLATTLAPISVPLPGGGSTNVWGVRGNSVTLSAAELTINTADLDPFFLGAGAYAAGPGGVLRLRADALTLNTALMAGPAFDGVIDIAPRTLGRAVVLGGTAADALSLSAADLARLYVYDIVIGRSENGAGALTVAGPASVLSGVETVLLQGSAITLDGRFSVPGAGALTLIAHGGDIVQNAGGAVTAGTLVATAQAGSVLLGGATTLNQVGRLSGTVATGGTFAFRGGGSYEIAAPGIDATGGTVALDAPSGGIGQALGAPIIAARLSANASGAVVLDGGGSTAGEDDVNRVGTLGPSSGTALTFRNAQALTVEGVTANGATGSLVVLEAPTLTLTGDVVASTADGRVILRTGGDFDTPEEGTAIRQMGGVIRTRDLSASAGDEIDLAGNNEIGRLAAGQGAAGASTDSIAMRGGGALWLNDAVGGIEVAARVNAGAGSAVQVVADGLTVAPGLSGTVFYAPGGVVRFLPFTAGATIGLGGTGDTMTYAASLLQRVDTGRLVIGSAAAGTITLRQALDLTGATGPDALELRSGGSILAGGFNLSVAEVSAVATGDVALGTAGSAIGRVTAAEGIADGIRAGGTISVVTGGTLTVDAAIRASGASVALQAGDFVIAAGAEVQTGAVPGSQVTLRSTHGSGLALGVTDAVAGLSQAEIALLDARGGTLRLEGSAVTLAGTVAVDAADAGVLILAASSGAVTQTAGTLAAGALRVSGSTVQIDRAGNSLPAIEATAPGGISIATDGATTVSGTSSALGDVAITAGSITLSDAAGTVAVSAAGTARLTATAGGITGTADLAAVQGTSLEATATGAITLTGNNAVGTLAAIAGTGVTFRNTIALTAGATGPAGTAIAGNVTFAAPSLRLNDVLATGTVDLTASAGAIDQAAGARLAAGILRAGATGSVILDGANPDGTARNQIQDIDALSAGGDITLRNSLALTLDLPLTVGAGQALTLEAPTLTIGDSLAAGAGGRILLRTGSFNGGVASGGDIIQTGGTITAPTLAALAGGAVSLDRDGNAIGALGGGRSAAGADLGLGLHAGASGVLRSTGYGGSAALGVTGALDIGAGGSLLLRADDFAIAAAIRVPAGTVTLLPYSAGAGIGYVLGGASGSTHAGRITLDSTELSFFPTGTPAAELILGALGVTGSVDIAGDVSLATGGGTPRVNRLTLIGDGALTQGPGTAIDVAALRAIFPNGAVLLDPGGAGNRIAALAGVVAGGDVNIRGGAGMMELRDGGSGTAITVNGTGRTVTLRADDLDIQGAVQVPAGTINILPETAGRDVTLGGNGAGTLALTAAEIERIGGGGAPLTAPAALRLRIGSDGTQRTAGDILVTGNVALRDGAAVRVGTLELVAGQPGTAGGSVRQSGGSVDVATVTGTAQGDFRLGLAGNAFDMAAGIAAGTLPTTGATGVVELATGGALTASAITAPVSIRLTAEAALSAGGITAPVILLQGDAVRLTDLIQGSTSVSIDSDGAVTQDAGALVVTGLFTLNGGSVSLPEDNEIVELNGLVATGPVFALNTILPLLVSGTVSADGSLSLTTSQGLTVANAGSITVTGGPGTATLTAGGGIDYAGTLTTSGAATLTAGGALSFSGVADVGGALQFGAGAGLTLAGTIAAGAGITGTAIGAIATTASLDAADDLELAAGTTLDIGGSWTAGGAARFIAGGLVTYTATGSAGADVTVTTPGGFFASAGSSIDGTGVVRLDAGNTLSALGTISGGPQVALFARTGAMTLGGTIASNGAVSAEAGSGLASTAAISGGGAVALTAGAALSVATSIEAGAALTLGAGTAMDIAGTWSAGGVAGFTAGGLVTYTATGSGDAGVTIATPGGITASAGSSINGGGAVRLDAGTTLSALGTIGGGPLVELSARAGAMTLGGTIGAGGDVAAGAGGALTSAATITAGGAATLAAGGALTVANRIAAGGALTLGAGTTMDVAGTWSAGGVAGFAAGGLVSYSATGTGAAGVTIATPGGIAASGGSSIVGAGAVRLDAGTTLSALGTLRGGPLVELIANSDAMTLAGTIGAAGDLAARAGAGLTTTATITAAGNAALAAGGALSAANRIDAAGSLTLSAGAAMDIAGGWSAGGPAGFAAGGTLSYGATGSGGGAVFLATPGAIIASASSAITAAGPLRLDAGSALFALGALASGATIDLRAGAGEMTVAGTVSASGAIAAAAGAALTTNALVTAGTDATLLAGGVLSATNRIAAARNLALRGGAGLDAGGTFTAGRDAVLASTGGAVSLVGSLGAGGGIALSAGGTLQSNAEVQAGGALAITAGGAITLATLHAAGTVLDIGAGGDLTASGTLAGGQAASIRAGQSMALQGLVQSGGGLVLRAGGRLVLAGTATAGGLIDAGAGGDLAQSGTLAGGEVALSAGGLLAQSGTVSAGGAMTLSGGGIASTGTLTAGGPTSLAAGAGLSQSGYLQSGQAVTLSAGGALTLSGQTVAATDIIMTAGGAATLTAGKITAAGEVRLDAGQGTVVQSFQIDPTIIAIQTGGSLLVEASELVSSESIRLAGSSVVLRGNAITTGTLDVDAGGTLVLDGGIYVIGRAVGFSAPAGITTPSMIIVAPRDGVLPAVVFDTRAAGVVPDPLTVVEPDIAGLPANQQATQVRVPGTEAPGAFGPASSAPAGTMQLDIDAGRSPVFLLLDGGTATGEIVSAGRIAIHGTGGSAELTGKLIDISGTPIAGQNAARFADSTRPASTGALTRYRINGCVVSSINCVVPSQVLSIPQAPPQRIDIRLWGGAITDPDVQLPNIADEDY
jgi:filamentous hemagglutinin family protein